MDRAISRPILVIALAAAVGGPELDADERRRPVAMSDAFFAHCAALHEQAREAETLAVRGVDGLLFLRAELRHLAAGPFWGERAADAGRAARPDQRDPLPVIVDYHRQLADRGIELIFVPVPPKAVIYRDKLPPGMPAAEADAEFDPAVRADVHHQRFYEKLRDRGVRVLDLTQRFLDARHADDGDNRPLYCRQDSHWSGRGVELAADALVNKIGTRDWMPERQARYDMNTRTVEIRGDLYDALDDDDLERERLELSLVDTDRAPVRDRHSPIVLLGDSHVLVFHIGGDMHATGGGLGDHLAHRLGFGLDVVGVRGSGASASRMALARRRDNLEGKKMVIWCLSARELTEASAWTTLPATLPQE